MITTGIAAELSTYELTDTFTWAGGSYLAAIGDLRLDKSLDIGGFSPVSTRQMVAAIDQFGGSYPEEQDIVTIQNRNLRVASVRISPDQTFVVLDCVDDNRGV